MTVSRALIAASSSAPSFSNSATILPVPSRHGVHWPQLSCRKNLSRLSVTALALSRSENTTIACEPTKAPCPASRSEEHTSELQSLMRISYAVLCLKKKTRHTHIEKQQI